MPGRHVDGLLRAQVWGTRDPVAFDWAPILKNPRAVSAPAQLDGARTRKDCSGPKPNFRENGQIRTGSGSNLGPPALPGGGHPSSPPRTLSWALSVRLEANPQDPGRATGDRSRGPHPIHGPHLAARAAAPSQASNHRMRPHLGLHTSPCILVPPVLPHRARSVGGTACPSGPRASKGANYPPSRPFMKACQRRSPSCSPDRSRPSSSRRRDRFVPSSRLQQSA